MTTSELSALALPAARVAVRASVGFPAWLVLRPLMPVLVRIAVELAVGLLAPALLPWLDVIEALLPNLKIDADTRAILSATIGLLRTPRAELSPAVLMAIPPQ